MIRWKQQGDTRGIVELVRKQLVPLSPWQHPRDGKLRFEVVRRLRRGPTFVASRSRQSLPHGFVHIEIRGAALFVDLLAVDGRHQNRRWGTELMNRAESYGRHKGCTVAYLFVDEGNARGIRFYKRLGYQSLAYVDALKAYHMHKSLVSLNDAFGNAF
ncbi:GNAT family N-acetyltransferase [Cohnella panacarvi]|uniref:GNAT family N-acetyltransferase n=1 Tax=Cohnella panacarvi TaxID=400776 RepID=UPI00047EE818|nr:GNAT family N-acetyltransferase [Cohnella panacarvi]